MTDKQIIIDGIDVSGCGYIDHDSAWCDLCMTNCAKETKPCYYKQLKAKEQECEELKELVKKQKDVLIHKTILADEYEKAYSFENLKVAKLKYCLTEIKEIAENVQSFVDINLEDDVYTEMDKILQKISECEVENE